MKEGRILILAKSKSIRDQLEGLLASIYEVVLAGDVDVLDMEFDLAILDLPALERLSKQVQSRRKQSAPVLLPFLLFAPRTRAEAAAEQLGGVVDELILNPIETAVLLSRVKNMLRMRSMSLELKRQRDVVRRLSVTDDVSGFHNTRFLHQFLDKHLAKTDSLVSLAFTDMDRFKTVVDAHGHLVGSKLLRLAAEVYDRHLGTEDRIVRYGGDEFVIILPNQAKEQALAKIEKLQEALAEEKFLEQEGSHVKLTASVGLATYPDDASDKNELLAAADKCLFKSKRKGRSQINVMRKR